jgi:hypothetical protein
MVDCAASIRAAGGSSSDLLTPRGLTAIYTGATDKYIKRLVRVDVSQYARIYIYLLSFGFFFSKTTYMSRRSGLSL